MGNNDRCCVLKFSWINSRESRLRSGLLRRTHANPGTVLVPITHREIIATGPQSEKGAAMQHLRLGLQAPWGTHERKRNRAGLALVLSVVLAPLYISQLCPWAAASNPIVIENQQPGSTGWQLSSKVSSEDIN